MKGSLRQRSPGSWELTIDLGLDSLGKRKRKFVTVQGTKAHAQRKLREFLSTLNSGKNSAVKAALAVSTCVVSPLEKSRTKCEVNGRGFLMLGLNVGYWIKTTLI